VFFIIVLTVQRRLRAVFDAMAGPRAFGLLAFAALVIATNWYLFISAVQSGQATEAALGYYIFPLVSVLLGRLVFGERLSPVQLFAVGLVTVAVSFLTYGLGTAPWLALAPLWAGEKAVGGGAGGLRHGGGTAFVAPRGARAVANG